MDNKLLKAEEYIKQNKHTVNEKYRFTYHAMPEIGWLNDPNGFSYYNGLYHLFYQYNPYGSVWGPMHWGHATSLDLVQWTYQPVALAPDEEYDQDGCFSGTAISDGDKHVLMYTSVKSIKLEKGHRVYQEQCIAIGDGKLYEKIPQNPVIRQEQMPEGLIKEDFRDPKLFVVEDIYYCIIGSKTLDQKSVLILFKSHNLTEWQNLGVIDQADEVTGGVWECPDFFNLDEKDVMVFSPQFKRPEGYKYHNIHSNCYCIGKLDLELGKFNTQYMDEMDSGFDFYAPQTLVDAKGRRIMIAWMQMWERNMPSNQENHHWAGAMTFPRELRFIENQLIQLPVEEIINYRRNEFILETQFSGTVTHEKLSGRTVELIIEFENINSVSYGVKLFVGTDEETVFEYLVDEERIVFDRRRSGVILKGHKNEISSSGIRSVQLQEQDKKLQMRFLLDCCSVEGFFNNGVKTMTGTIYAAETSKGVELFSSGKVNVHVKKYDLVK